MPLTMKQPIITIRDLSVTYDTVRALEHVDLDIYADDFLGIIGPNGGGKSTLVKAIMGIVPHRGTINFDTSIMRHGKPHIGYLPQVSSFDKVFPISVLEVVMSGLQAERGMLRRYGKAERERKPLLTEKFTLFLEWHRTMFIVMRHCNNGKNKNDNAANESKDGNTGRKIQTGEKDTNP